MAVLDPHELHAKLLVGLAAKDDDPLRWWKFGVDRFKPFFNLYVDANPIHEGHLRGPNKGTKTQTAAAYVMACLEKRTHLDGVPLPQWRGPVEAAQLVLDYPQQLLSVQAAYLKVLGNWPHRPGKDGEILKSLRVKPIGGSDNEATWSVIHFLSQKNLTSGKGVRADIVSFDEPPVMSILQELRKAAHAGRRGIRIIAETPIKRREWHPLLADYGESPRRAIRRVDRLRAECRWSLDEVADWVLSAEEKQDLWESYRGDPLFGKDGGARWHGDYTNTEGSCPLDAEVIYWLIEQCEAPKMEGFRIPRETENGAPIIHDRVDVEIYRGPQTITAAYMSIDPASGIDDGKHNPLCLQIAEEGTGDLLARWNGYIDPYSLGILAATLARQYKNARIDIEMKDHWGVNVVRGCHASRYGNLCQEERELKPGVIAKEAGFDATDEARAIWIGQIQEWLAAWRAAAEYDEQGQFTGFGEGAYAKCPSRAVLNSLLDTELDERDKIVAIPGVNHGEDMVCWGQKLRKAVRRSNRLIPRVQKPPQSPDQPLIDLIRGGREKQPPFGQRTRVYRGRP